jgi:hypothetical protein
VRLKRKGSPAKFSWQTILTLRVAAPLRDRFDLELQAHKASFAAWHQQVGTHSFITLWGKSLALLPGGQWSLVETKAPTRGEDSLVVRLGLHLSVIRAGFARLSAAEEQLNLFRLPTAQSTTQAAPPRGSARVGERRVA